MIEALRQIQLEAGAVVEGSENIPISFNNDRQALIAVKENIALYDRTHWGIIKISGNDRLRYLHNQSTNNFNSLQPGDGCETVFITSTARTIDLAAAYLTEDSILLIVSPNRRLRLLEWLDRFIFPMDKVELTDLSCQYNIFSAIGPKCDTLMKALGLSCNTNRQLYSHKLVDLDGTLIRLAVGNELGLPGYTLIVPQERAAIVWSKLIEKGSIPMGERVWESLRIKQGRPVPERELTEDYNPLEVGLWQTISFDKGCYIGQETIVRLNTYKGVKQRLWGVELTETVEPHTLVNVGEEKVGILTSCTPTENGAFGLAYVRTKAGGVGLSVSVGKSAGTLVKLPFVSHDYYEPN
jgi:hypothetical protein